MNLYRRVTNIQTSQALNFTHSEPINRDAYHNYHSWYHITSTIPNLLLSPIPCLQPTIQPCSAYYVTVAKLAVYHSLDCHNYHMYYLPYLTYIITKLYTIPTASTESPIKYNIMVEISTYICTDRKSKHRSSLQQSLTFGLLWPP